MWPKLKTIQDHVKVDQLMYYILCVALFSLPFGTSPFTILGMCMVLVWLFSGEWIKRWRIFFEEPWIWPVIAWTALIWIGLLYTPDRLGMGLKYAKKSYYWIYALAVVSISLKPRPMSIPIKAFLLGLFINSIVGYLQWGNIIPDNAKDGIYGSTGFYGGYNTLSVFLNIGMLTASFYFKKSAERRDKFWYGFLLLFYFVHLLFLGSRGGYLVFALVSPIIVYHVIHNKSIIVIVLAYVCMIGVMFVSPVIRDRASQTITDLRDHISDSSNVKSGEKYSKHLDRIYMWRWAIHLFKQHPFIGVGTGGYQQSTLNGGGDMGVAHPHNNFLHIAVSYGIIGLAVFGWFFWTIFAISWKNRQSVMGFFIFSSALILFVGGLTETHIIDSGTGRLLAVMTGLLSTLPRKEISVIRFIRSKISPG